MVVNPVHSVAVNEEQSTAACAVRYHSLKPAVQSGRKAGVFFVKTYQIIGTIVRLNLPPLPDAVAV